MQGEKVVYNSNTESIDPVRVSLVVEYAVQLEGTASDSHA
jgi:hypothetical protein